MFNLERIFAQVKEQKPKSQQQLMVQGVTEQSYKSQRLIQSMDFFELSKTQTLFAISSKHCVSLLLYKNKQFKILQKIQIQIDIKDNTQDYSAKNLYTQQIWNFFTHNRAQFDQKKENLLVCRFAQIIENNQSKLLISLGGETGIIHLITITKDQKHHYMQGHYNLITDLKYHQSHQNELFSSSKDGSIIRWCLMKKRVLQLYRETLSTAEVSSIAVTETQIFASTSDGFIKVWSIKNNQVEKVISFQWEHNFVNQIEIIGGFLIYRVANGKIILQCLSDDVILDVLHENKSNSPFCRFSCTQQGQLAYQNEKGILMNLTLSDAYKKFSIQLNETGTVPFYLEKQGKYLLQSDNKLQILQ